jgi:hypothetical protein
MRGRKSRAHAVFERFSDRREIGRTHWWMAQSDANSSLLFSTSYYYGGKGELTGV